MTALSGVAQLDAAYLLTDGASTSADHRVAEIGCKVVDLPAQRMAVAWSGYVMISDLEAGITAAGHNQREILAALPDISRKIAASNVEVGLRDGRDAPPVNLLVALWDDAADVAKLWAIHSTSTIFGPRYVPFTPMRLRNCTALDRKSQIDAFGRIPDYCDPSDFDVRRDGLRMLEAERRLVFPGGYYAVGGYAHLTTVSAAGVTIETLRTWPDKVGCRIDPFA